MTSLPLLLFGHDPDLLKLRLLVLERAGFVVRSVGTLDWIGRELTEWRPALLVLCHTVPAKECHVVMWMAQQCVPPVPVISLSGSHGACVQGATAVVDSLGGPSKLIAKIGSLLEAGSAASQRGLNP